MPFTVDEERMQGKPIVRNGQNLPPILSLDPAKPPVISIPHAEFPRVVYKHPNDAFFLVEHRNTKHEIVEEELVATEHESKLVHSEEELEAALADGWVKEPYLPEPIPDKRAALYSNAKGRARRKESA
jgi:hypothetical protein